MIPRPPIPDTGRHWQLAAAWLLVAATLALAASRGTARETVEPGDARRVARFGGAVLAGMVQSDQVGFLAGAERGLLAVQPPLGLGEFMPSRVRSRIRSDSNAATMARTVRLPSPIRDSQRLPASRQGGWGRWPG